MAKRSLLSQHFEQNALFLQAIHEHLAAENVDQYQKEERALIAKRVRVSHGRFNALMEVMREDIISQEEHISRLRDQLAHHYRYQPFQECYTMGDLVYTSMQVLLANNKPASQRFEKGLDYL